MYDGYRPHKCMDEDLIDTSGPTPMLAGERVSVLDVYDAATSDDGDIETVRQMWGLSEEQVEAALAYYEEHETEMEEVREQRRNHIDDMLNAPDAD